jgi:PAS domain S-box-containing protein
MNNAQENKQLNTLLKQIEIAKKEWEETMDCVGDMIILTDSDGIIKRINRAVAEFTGKSYEEILGATWEDLIIENEMEATTLYAGCTELCHRPTRRWFELNAYPFEDNDLGFSGNVLTIHETTEVKRITEALEKSKGRADRDRKNLKEALTRLCSLMENVIQQGDMNVRVPNPNLRKCYEVKNCNNESCPCHGMEAVRCWQVAGTFCNDKAQGSFAQKYGNCSECEVYKKATSDPIHKIGEHFNNMMHIFDPGAAESEG